MPDGGFTARVDSLLLELASQEATGCLTVTEPQGEQATVWFRDGDVYVIEANPRASSVRRRAVESVTFTPRPQEVA